MGIFAEVFVALGLAEFIKTYNLGILKHVITFSVLGIPLINMVGVRYAVRVADAITLVIIAFSYYWLYKTPLLGDNVLTVPLKWTDLMRAFSLSTLLSLVSSVQLSEETVSRDIIPNITASVIFTTIFHALVIISVISIIV